MAQAKIEKCMIWWYRDDCAGTNPNSPPWLYVDLQGQYIITRVTLMNYDSLTGRGNTKWYSTKLHNAILYPTWALSTLPLISKWMCNCHPENRMSDFTIGVVDSPPTEPNGETFPDMSVCVDFNGVPDMDEILECSSDIRYSSAPFSPGFGHKPCIHLIGPT